jgi:hypothetical protein
VPLGLYTLLLKYARQAGGCWPGVERLSKDLDKEPRPRSSHSTPPLRKTRRQVREKSPISP